MLGVRLCEECALVVVKPPRQAFGAAILEVDDGVLVAVKHGFVKELAGAVHQPQVMDLRSRIDPSLVQPGEERGRTSAVKTTVVEANANSHKTIPLRLAPCTSASLGRKLVKLRSQIQIVKRKGTDPRIAITAQPPARGSPPGCSLNGSAQARHAWVGEAKRLGYGADRELELMGS